MVVGFHGKTVRIKLCYERFPLINDPVDHGALCMARRTHFLKLDH